MYTLTLNSHGSYMDVHTDTIQSLYSYMKVHIHIIVILII